MNVTISGPAGPLEGLVEEPPTPRAAVVFAHPLPTHGGTMHTKAVYQAAKAFARIGDFAIPFLIEALEREKNAARQKPLIEALERMGPSAGPGLAAALKKATPEVKKAAAQVVVKMEAQPAPMPRKDHVGPTGAIQSQLRGWFNATDTNKDGFLDKDELARAIRETLDT